ASLQRSVFVHLGAPGGWRGGRADRRALALGADRLVLPLPRGLPATSRFRLHTMGVGAMQLDRMERTAKPHHLAQDLGEMLRPFGLPLRPKDQVLADLDQRMRKSALGAVPVERVALELSRVRRVVADHDTRDGPEAFKQGKGKPRVLVP